jgi:hypothetical protein
LPGAALLLRVAWIERRCYRSSDQQINLPGIGLTLAAGMSALTLDLGEICGLFTRLAAVIAIFRGGASARGMCTFVQSLNTHFSSRLFSGGAATATDQVDYKNHQCHHHQQMNQASGYVEYETQQPKNQKYCDNRSQQSHSTSPPI